MAAAGMPCEIVVRAASPADMEARADLVRRSIIEHDFDAFVMFFFQELTLQVCVLCGAVLFIFVGAGLAACALVVPGAAAALALAVLATHRATAHTHVRRLRHELFGLVAEYRGPLVADPSRVRAPVVLQPAGERGPGGGGPGGGGPGGGHARLVGTVSVAECWGPRRSGWLHALAVDPQWRRRGVGSALVQASGARALGAGLDSLEAVTSQLQHAARGLLHTAGWEMRGSYHRPVLGAALTLSMTQLGAELPHTVAR